MPLPHDVESEVELRKSVLLTVDLNHRHLDVGGIGYHTLPKDRADLVLARGAVALQAARDAGMPVVHITTLADPPTPWGPRGGKNPFMVWQTGKPIPGAGFVRGVPQGRDVSRAGEIMPQVAPLAHEPIVVKKRYSGFYMTDLEMVLRGFGIETIFLMGVNTNNCCLHTTFDAQARDFGVVILEDACGSMNGQAYHESAIKQIEAALGWVISVDDFRSVVQQAAAVAG